MRSLAVQNGGLAVQSGGLAQTAHPLVTQDLIHDLFAFARDSINGASLVEYSEPGHKGSRYNPQLLPEQFQPLTFGQPGPFYVVAFEDLSFRRANEGPKDMSVRLSTSPYKYEFEGLLTEIEIIRPDPTRPHVGQYQVRISNSVNNQSFSELNRPGIDPEKPHGSVRRTYALGAARELVLQTAEFDRLDEAVVEWRNENTRLRLLRSLEVTSGKNHQNQVEFRESFLFGLENDGPCSHVSNVRVQFTEVKGEFRNVKVYIGTGHEDFATVINESADGRVAVREHPAHGARVYMNQLEIAALDPCYQAIIQRDMDIEQFLRLLREKIDLIAQHWDRSQNVIGAPELTVAPDDLSDLSADRSRLPT